MFAAGVATLVAEDKPLVETIALAAPQVVQLDWNTRALTAADLSGNGLTDLVVLNNDRAQIDLLYQLKPGTYRHRCRLPSASIAGSRSSPMRISKKSA